MNNETKKAIELLREVAENDGFFTRLTGKAAVNINVAIALLESAQNQGCLFCKESAASEFEARETLKLALFSFISALQFVLGLMDSKDQEEASEQARQRFNISMEFAKIAGYEGDNLAEVIGSTILAKTDGVDELLDNAISFVNTLCGTSIIGSTSN